MDILQLQCSGEVENFDSQPSQIYLNDFSFEHWGGGVKNIDLYARSDPDKKSIPEI